MTFSVTPDRTVRPSPRVFANGRAGTRIDRVVLHHMAGRLPHTLHMMTTGSRVVSSTYCVGSSGEIVGVVPEGDTPFTNGNQAWNRRSITLEIENETFSPTWGVSAAAHEAAARIVAAASTRYGFPINSDTVVGHRDLWIRFRAGYATACPGGLDVAGIIRRAQEIQGGAPVAPSAPAPAPAAPASAGPRILRRGSRGADVAELQRLVGVAADGIYGPVTERAVRAYQASRGLTVDGIVGPQTWASLRSGRPPVARPVSRPILRRGARGEHVEHLQRRLGGLVVDGIYGPATEARVRAFQRAHGIAVDGIVGPVTWSRLG